MMGTLLSGNAARLQAMNNVEAYVPPAFSFDPGEAPGEVFGSNVFTKSGDAETAAQAGLTSP